MKIRIFRKECLYGLLLSALLLSVGILMILDDLLLKAILLFLCIPFFVLVSLLYYETITLSDDNVVLTSNFVTKLRIGYRRIYNYSDFSHIYIATIKEGTISTKWIIMCQYGQEHNRINVKELKLPIKDDGFIAFKYSELREKIVLDTFADQVNIVVEHIDVDNSTGQRTVRSSSKI